MIKNVKLSGLNIRIATVLLNTQNLNNLYGRAMSQKLPANNFESIKDTSQINAYFIKNYNGESYEEYFFEVEIQYLEILHELSIDSPFLPEKIRIEKV